MRSEKPRICIIPYGTRIGPGITAMRLADCSFPLEAGRNSRSDGDDTLRDLGSDDHVLVYPTRRLFFTPFFGLKAKLSLIIAEPRAIHERHMRSARLFAWKFHRILTSDSVLLEHLSNARIFQSGATTWIPNWRDLDVTKTRMLSVIASEKTELAGHRHRHALVKWLRDTGSDADILGRAYKPFDKKAEGLAPYRFSAIIENSSEQSYFTEKLIDAFLCETVPIYWGAPNIADFFDIDGMIICRTLDELKSAARSLSDKDYQGRRSSININKNLAAKYENVEISAAKLLLSEL